MILNLRIRLPEAELLICKGGIELWPELTKNGTNCSKLCKKTIAEKILSFLLTDHLERTPIVMKTMPIMRASFSCSNTNWTSHVKFSIKVFWHALKACSRPVIFSNTCKPSGSQITMEKTHMMTRINLKTKVINRGKLVLRLLIQRQLLMGLLIILILRKVSATQRLVDVAIDLFDFLITKTYIEISRRDQNL